MNVKSQFIALCKMSFKSRRCNTTKDKNYTVKMVTTVMEIL